jgi:hypothetical protein
MGLICSPDIVHTVMENVLSGIDVADLYSYDVGAFSLSWEHPFELLHTILRCLQDNVFTINPLKCESVVHETDWLGDWLAPCGLKLWKMKMDAILYMDHP